MSSGSWGDPHPVKFQIRHSTDLRQAEVSFYQDQHKVIHIISPCSQKYLGFVLIHEWKINLLCLFN